MDAKRRVFERFFILATIALGVVAAYISIGFIVRGTQMANADPVIRELATSRGILFCIAASTLAFISKVMSGSPWSIGRVMLTGFLALLAAYNFLSIIVVQVTAAESNNAQAMASAATVSELEAQLKIYQTQAEKMNENAGAIKSSTGKALTQQEEVYGRSLARQAAARAAMAASEAAAIKRQLDDVRATHMQGPTFATALCRTTDKVAGDPQCAKASYWQYGYEIVGGMILDLISIVCFGWAGSLLRREIDHETKQAAGSGWFGGLLRSAGKRLRIGAVAAGTAAAAAATGSANAYVPPTIVPASEPAPAPTSAPVSAPLPSPEHTQSNKIGQVINPCPECGNDERFSSDSIKLARENGVNQYYSVLKCMSCNHSIKTDSLPMNDLPTTVEESDARAIAVWNANTQPAQNPASFNVRPASTDAPVSAPGTAPAPTTVETGSAPVEQPANSGSAPVQAPVPAPAPAPLENGSAPFQQPTNNGSASAESLADKVENLSEQQAEEVLLLTGYRWRLVSGAIQAGACTPSERNVRDLAACNRDTAVNWLTELVAQQTLKTERVGESGALRYKLS